MGVAMDTVSKILVVDDDAEARKGFSYTIEDMGLTPVFEEGPIDDIHEFVGGIFDRAQAVLCDYRLKERAYSAVDGDRLAAQCYRQGIPALLCTQFTDVGANLSRKLRRFIPSLILTSSPGPDDIRLSLERCRAELRGSFHPGRRPWRTLVRVISEVEEGGYCYVLVPAWSTNQEIRLYREDVPSELHSRLRPDARLHAKVNIGADSFEDIYFDEWES